jgi:peptidoglycan hydrolase-like protein with peptidoglycan-binding domain
MPSEGGDLSKICLSRQGDAGSGVNALQGALKFCYGKNIAIDGQFGPATRSALVQVQSSIGTTADGIYGPDTMSRMYFPTYYGGGCYYKGSQYDKYGWWPGP